MFEGVIVKHKAWGQGTIVSVDEGHIVVDFQGMEKTLAFPDSIGTFLQTDDPQLISSAKAEKEKKNKEIEKKKAESLQKTQEMIKQKAVFSGDESDYESPLLGRRSGDIVFASDEDFYEAIGYLARPGRIAFYQAELTEDKEMQFNKLFPNQEYRVIKASYGKNGLPTKQGCQFRINLSTIDGCPVTLLNHVGERNGHWAGRISRSKFALRLVQNNGFTFGHDQNVEQIKAKVPSKYEAAFLKGFNIK